MSPSNLSGNSGIIEFRIRVNRKSGYKQKLLLALWKERKTTKEKLLFQKKILLSLFIKVSIICEYHEKYADLICFRKSCHGVLYALRTFFLLFQSFKERGYFNIYCIKINNSHSTIHQINFLKLYLTLFFRTKSKIKVIRSIQSEGWFSLSLHPTQILIPYVYPITSNGK